MVIGRLLTLGRKLANGVEYLFSTTSFASAGPSRLFYQEFDTPETNRGIAQNRDGDRFWSTLGKVSYGDFTLQGGWVTLDVTLTAEADVRPGPRVCSTCTVRVAVPTSKSDNPWARRSDQWQP